MSLEFYQTVGGRQFIDGTMKDIALSLEKIVDKMDKKDCPKCNGVAPDSLDEGHPQMEDYFNVDFDNIEDDGNVVFSHTDTALLLTEKGRVNPYPIELSRIKTHLHLVSWLHHLTQKNWFNTTDARNMIEYVGLKIHDWNIYDV